jgi:predicted NBD/HSP70 family sugar kinase
MKETFVTLIDLLRRHRAMTKQELIDASGFSLSSINNYLKEMDSRDLINTGTHPVSSVGRKPNSIALREDLFYAVGIDIGGWSVRVLVSDAFGDIVASSIFPSRLQEGPESVFGEIGSRLGELLSSSSIPVDKVCGVGVAISGFLDTSTMTCIKVPFFSCWNDTPIAEMAARFLPLPRDRFLAFEDSARTMTLAELRYGRGQDLDTFFLVNIGAGLGGGLVLNRQVFWGEKGFATEIGHIRVSPENKICICGKQGCLETYASSWALRRQAEIDLAQGVQTSVSLPPSSTTREIQDATPIYRACAAGDRYANTLIKQMCLYLCQVTSIITQMVDPTTIILAGGVVREIPQIILKHLSTFHEHGLGRDTSFEVSPLREFSSAQGAATLALDEMFENGSILPFLSR